MQDHRKDVVQVVWWAPRRLEPGGRPVCLSPVMWARIVAAGVATPLGPL